MKKLILLNQKIPRIFIDVKLLIQIKILNIKKTLLDIGAGFGIFAYKMKQMGWSTDVIEIDPNLKKFLREELKLNVIKENFLKHSFKKVIL